MQGFAGLIHRGTDRREPGALQNKIRGHKDIIEGLVRQAKTDLDGKIKKLEHFKVSNNIINLGEHTKAIVVYLVQLEGQRASLLSKIAAGNREKRGDGCCSGNGNEITLDLATHEEIHQPQETTAGNESPAPDRLPSAGK